MGQTSKPRSAVADTPPNPDKGLLSHNGPPDALAKHTHLSFLPSCDVQLDPAIRVHGVEGVQVAQPADQERLLNRVEEGPDLDNGQPE